MKNSERTMVSIVKDICSENGIAYKSFSYDWIFQLSKNGKTVHIYGYHFENNSATAQLICSDKSAASDLLNYNGVPAVEHTLFMSPTDMKYLGETGNWERLMELLKRYNRIVCKKNEGTGGNDVYLVSNRFELENAVHNIFKTSRTMSVCPFYNIEQEYRIIILNGKIKLIYSKNIPYVEGDGAASLRQLLIKYMQDNNDFMPDFNILDLKDKSKRVLKTGQRYYLNWKHNLGQGADPQIVEDENTIDILSALALQAAKVINIKFASVDIIKTNDEYLVLEINSGIMMENFSNTSENNYQRAKSIYKEAIESLIL